MHADVTHSCDLQTTTGGAGWLSECFSATQSSSMWCWCGRISTWEVRRMTIHHSSDLEQHPSLKGGSGIGCC